MVKNYKENGKRGCCKIVPKKMKIKLKKAKAYGKENSKPCAFVIYFIWAEKYTKEAHYYKITSIAKRNAERYAKDKEKAAGTKYNRKDIKWKKRNQYRQPK